MIDLLLLAVENLARLVLEWAERTRERGEKTPRPIMELRKEKWQ